MFGHHALSPMQQKVVELCIDIPRAVVLVPSVIVGPELGLKRGHGRQQLRADGLLGEPLPALQPPDVVVLDAEKAMPLLADEQAIAEAVEVELGEYRDEDVVGKDAEEAVHAGAAAAPGTACSGRRPGAGWILVLQVGPSGSAAPSA